MCGGFAPPRPAGYLDQNEGRVAFGSDEMADELLNCEPRRAARAGGREARRAARAAPLAENLRPVRAGMAGGQYKPLTEAGVEKIHQSALEALEVIGLSQAPKSGVEILTGAGAIQGDDGRIRFPRALVEDMLAVAARNITLHARDPKFDLHLSGTNVHYGTAGAAVHIVDPVTLDYRESTAQDLYDAARLVENLDNIHFYQRTMVCRDVVDNKEMDLNTLYGCLAGTRKHVGTSFSDPSHVADCFDMLYTVAGGFRPAHGCHVGRLGRTGAADRRLRADAPFLRPARWRGLGHFRLETARHAGGLGTGYHQFPRRSRRVEHVL